MSREVVMTSWKRSIHGVLVTGMVLTLAGCGHDDGPRQSYEPYDPPPLYQRGPDTNPAPAPRHFDTEGYDAQGLDQNGFDRGGYDREGYNHSGFNRDGFDRLGYDR